MLTTTLTTNEVKDAAGLEVEFQSRGISGSEHVFSASAEAPALRHRLRVAHSESGKGLMAKRDSIVQVTLEKVSDVDNVTTVPIVATLKLSAPVGAQLTTAAMKQALAELGSFCFLTGADSTFKYDGTGTGCAALLSGGI